MQQLGTNQCGGLWYVLSCSAMSHSWRPHGLQPARLLCPRDSPGKNTGVGSLFLLQWWFGGVLKSIVGFPSGSMVKNPPANAGDPWVRKIPWKRRKMATPSSIPAWEIPQTEELAGYSPWGHKRHKTEQLSHHHQKISWGHKQELDN